MRRVVDGHRGQIESRRLRKHRGVEDGICVLQGWRRAVGTDLTQKGRETAIEHWLL